MASLFESLGSVLEDSEVNASVTLQADQLAQILTTVGGLIGDPPAGFQDFFASISELPLPNLQFSGSLGAAFDALGELIPADLGDVTSELTGTLADLEARVKTELTGPLNDAIAAVNALHA